MDALCILVHMYAISLVWDTELVHGVSLCRQRLREGTHHGMEHVVPNTGKRAQRGPRTLAISPNPASEKDKRAGGQRNQAESSLPRVLPNALLSIFYFPPPLLYPTIYPHGRTYYPHPCRRWKGVSVFCVYYIAAVY